MDQGWLEGCSWGPHIQRLPCKGRMPPTGGRARSLKEAGWLLPAPGAWGRGSGTRGFRPPRCQGASDRFIHSSLGKSFFSDALAPTGQGREKALEGEDPDSGWRAGLCHKMGVNKGQGELCLPQETEAQEPRRGMKAENLGQGVTSQQSRRATLSSGLERESRGGPGVSQAGVTPSYRRGN